MKYQVSCGNHFKFVELTEVMRQSDPEFVQLLARLRKGMLTVADHEKLKSRVIHMENKDDDCDEYYSELAKKFIAIKRSENVKSSRLSGMCLFAKHDHTRAFNKSMMILEKVRNVVSFYAQSPDGKYVDKKGSKSKKNSEQSNSVQSVCGLDECLRIGIG